MKPALLKKSDVRQILPQRNLESHKGENGRVLVVGGSLEYYGAPLLSALGALNAGCDLVSLLVPEVNFDVSRSYYPDFIVRQYEGTCFNEKAVEPCLELLKKADAVLFGPGMTKNETVLSTLQKILSQCDIPVVLDADAISLIQNLPKNQKRPVVMTPHAGEFEETSGKNISALSMEEKSEVVLEYAKKWGCTILLKGHGDVIASEEGFACQNQKGNPGMTVGGTGDVLAGFVASLISQKVPPFEAACAAAYLNGFAGDTLAKSKGYAFSATDLALELPYAMQEIL